MKNKRQRLLQDLIEKLTQMFQSLHKNQRFSFDGLVLSRQQMMMLFFIYENKGVSSVKEIAKFLNVTSGAVTQFADGLVEQKLVRREVSPLDRRIVNIKLSGNVKKDFNNFKREYIELANKSFAGLNDEELRQFVGLLEKINRANNQKN
jgi:DNA-binding MarR family transcriptional regulator